MELFVSEKDVVYSDYDCILLFKFMTSSMFQLFSTQMLDKFFDII